MDRTLQQYIREQINLTLSKMRFQFRRGTASSWAFSNPVLRDGEPGFVRDTNTLKIGDGSTPWDELPGLTGGGDPGDLPDPWIAPVNIENDDNEVYGFTIDRTDDAESTDDPEIFRVLYKGQRATWTNEKGNLRTSNMGSPAEVILKLISANGGTGNFLEALTHEGVDLFRIGPAGVAIANVGIRLTVSPAAGKFLRSDESGNGSWQSPFVQLTQTQYDELSVKDPYTLYVIVDD